MAQTAKTAPAKAPFLAGSVLWERKGPLPVWAWALIGLGLVLVIVWWRRNRAAADETVTGGYTGFYRDELPGDQGSPPIIVLPQPITPPINVGPFPITLPPAPPAGGAPPPTTGSIPTHAEAPVNEDLYNWLDRLNTDHPGLNTNFGKLDLYNPNWRQTKGLKWRDNPANPNAKIPYLTTKTTLRVR